MSFFHICMAYGSGDSYFLEVMPPKKKGDAARSDPPAGARKRWVSDGSAGAACVVGSRARVVGCTRFFCAERRVFGRMARRARAATRREGWGRKNKGRQQVEDVLRGR